MKITVNASTNMSAWVAVTLNDTDDVNEKVKEAMKLSPEMWSGMIVGANSCKIIPCIGTVDMTRKTPRFRMTNTYGEVLK